MLRLHIAVMVLVRMTLVRHMEGQGLLAVGWADLTYHPLWQTQACRHTTHRCCDRRGTVGLPGHRYKLTCTAGGFEGRFAR
jgi:hypothetical protein